MIEMPIHRWLYRGQPERTIDGDSVVIRLDLGLGVHLGRGNEGAHIRLLGVDTPERNEPGWFEAKAFTEGWLAVAARDGPWGVLIETVRADAFGRYLGTIWRVSDQRCLNDDLLSAGLAQPYRAAIAARED